MSHRMNFSEIARQYDRRAHLQASAGERLLALAEVKPSDDVLDLGCGTGKLTEKLRQLTEGRVVGLDSEVEMLRQAKNRCQGLEVDFVCLPAEEMAFKEEFDLIFCNSAFQWFQRPEEVLRRSYEALRPGGRMAVQAPARRNYCPNFLRAIERVRQDPLTGGLFRHFQSPWFFLETEDEYRRLFEESGFRVGYVKINETITEHTPEEVFRVFDSGASAGYLNQRYYSVDIDDACIERFRGIVMEDFRQQADSRGMVSLCFFRVYVIAIKMY